MSEEKVCWYCETCNVFGTKKDIFDNHFAINHLIKQRLPFKDRLVFTSGTGDIFVTVDDITYKIIVIVEAFRSPFSHANLYKNPELSLMGIVRHWEYLGQIRLDCDLTNLSKKLSLCIGEMTHPITEQELTGLFTEAIKSARYTETLEKNTVIVHICLSTDLETKAPDSTSHWIVVTTTDLKKLEITEEEVLRKVKERTRVLTQRDIEAGL